MRIARNGDQHVDKPASGGCQPPGEFAKTHRARVLLLSRSVLRCIPNYGRTGGLTPPARRRLRVSASPHPRIYSLIPGPRSLAPARTAFTVVELLVVIAIIAILLVISLGVYGNLIQGAREKATRATITKINGLLKDRLRGFDIAFTEGKFDADIATMKSQLMSAMAHPPYLTMQLDGPEAERLKKVLARKHLMRAAFPQQISTPSGPAAQAAESAEALYEMLTSDTVFGATPVGEDEFSSSEIADTDGDGRMEFVDAWTRPLRFYLFPTRLVRTGGFNPMLPPTAGIQNAFVKVLSPSGVNEELGRDPGDPLGDLANPNTGTLATNLDPDVFESTLHTLITFHSPLIVSAGVDGLLGLEEPWNTGSFGHLAQPSNTTVPLLSDSPLFDNITNQQTGGN